MKKTIALLAALCATASLGAQVFITTFGSDHYIDLSESLDSQTESTGRFISVDLTSASFYGDFVSPANIPGFTTTLSLTATVFDNPGTGFQIALSDGTNSYAYQGYWSDFDTGVESTALLHAVSGQTAPFDFTQISGLDIYFDAGFGETLDVSFGTLTATVVPEPAAFASFAGLAVLGYGVVRRRRR